MLPNERWVLFVLFKICRDHENVQGMEEGGDWRRKKNRENMSEVTKRFLCGRTLCGSLNFVKGIIGISS